MNNKSFKEVKAKCIEGRFFPYDDWRDKIFVPPSIILVWFFVNLRISGNIVSYLSGLVAIIGGCLIASQNKVFILIGTFCYMLYYLLDYVDGGVSRFNGSSGIGGQYIDWLMHTVSSLGIFIGIFIGALSDSSIWLVPLGSLTIISCALNLERHSFAWFSICMHYQQQKSKSSSLVSISFDENVNKFKPNMVFKGMKFIIALIFHENFSIFILPLMAFINLFTQDNSFDFRKIIILIGGIVYFPIILIDIWLIAKSKQLESSYNNIFFENKKPNLPNDHFFG